MPKNKQIWKKLTFFFTSIVLLLLFFLLQTRRSYLEIRGVTPTASQAQVFYDSGDGFNENESIRLTPKRKRIDVRVNLPKTTKSIRFDPSTTDQPTKWGSLKLKRCGELSERDLIESGATKTENIERIESSAIDKMLKIIPDSGNQDPIVIFELDQPALPPFDRSVSLVFYAIVFSIMLVVIYSGLGRALALLNFYMISPWLSKCRNRKRFLQKCLVAILLGVMLTSLVEHRHQNTYEFQAKVKNSNESRLDLFLSWTPTVEPDDRCMAWQMTANQSMDLRYSFEAMDVPRIIRIDPEKSDGSLEMSPPTLKKGAFFSMRLPFSSISISESAHFVDHTAEKVVISCASEDPFLLINLDTIQLDFHIDYSELIRIFLTTSVLSLAVLVIAERFIKWSVQRRFLFKNIQFLILPIGIIYLVFTIGFFCLFYPGGISGDVAGNLWNTLHGKISAEDPPLLQHCLRLLQNFTYSVWPILLIQLCLYFSGFFLLSLYFLRSKEPFWAILVLFTSILPSVFYLNTTIIKDTLVAGLWINIFGILLHSARVRSKRTRWFILTVVILLLITSVLVRDNTFMAIPGFLLMIYVSNPKPGTDYRNIKILSFTSILVTVVSIPFSYNLMNKVNDSLLGSSAIRDYENDFFINQVCLSDLISLSILNQHADITKNSPPKVKTTLEEKYLLGPVYWLDDRIKASLTVPEEGIAKNWEQTIINRPITYFNYRLRVFLNQFIGKPSLKRSSMLTSDDLSHYKSQIEADNKTTLATFETPERLKTSKIRMAFFEWADFYFSKIDGFLLAVTFLTYILFLFGYKSRINREKQVIITAFIVFLLYTLPNLIFVQHVEPRYVYPAVVLLVAGLPIILKNIVDDVVKETEI